MRHSRRADSQKQSQPKVPASGRNRVYYILVSVIWSDYLSRLTLYTRKANIEDFIDSRAEDFYIVISDSKNTDLSTTRQSYSLAIIGWETTLNTL